MQRLFINPKLILIASCLWYAFMLSTPLVYAEIAPCGTAITNGGDNGSPTVIDGIVNQPGDVVLKYNNGKSITCLPTIITVGQVHEIIMTNTTGKIQEIPVGSSAYYLYQVTNTGNGADEIRLSFSLIGKGGTWTALLVKNQQDVATTSLLHINPAQTQSFYLKVIPPTGISGSCTVTVTATDSYFYNHNAGDGWPQGHDADVRQDVVTVAILSSGKLIEKEHGGQAQSQDKKAEVIIPPNVLPVDSFVRIIPVTATASVVSAGMIAAIADPSMEPIPGTVTYEFVAVNNNNQPINQFKERVTISISYPDNDHDGFVDGTNIHETTLRIFRLNEQTQRFEIIPDSWVEPEANRVVAGVDHFSYYSILAYTQKVMGISEAVNYPNPFDMTTDDYMTFGPLPLENVVVEIYTIDGELVQVLASQNGVCHWDGRNSNGDKVSSGMYVYMVKMKAQRKVGKMTVIR
ncbi:hypothetical protein AUJ95_04985 [Candidatus Desantisbacteria bacterium CG2_30_40_21]|uniref:FlgD Ig-like domain-containing protein n=5 Tax=unclassified Candidatus Desantisiibacteriota TaxID=3106372 RepID=A0A2M7JAB5_9BACT|nr:MAG: hypothetical protein AUJ95_04985 [Candidatus Desantisbacteria bacterium CG2_30_40_21]PIP41379.1 MAG: hypothetical protein COX18_03525 [Candidatus Desantisbacteria bacterium CG23_combo_of_CG06-09_8_20_14_all_40_23]PIX16311.1 MAG: hypothetical protein COZ71_08045 [Candidatus Desantisbacteria bacterium CG_4_8_14_3_um_filter_40_12]PIY19730.1 MAG: hypothetical protein COZ13_03870 [Candidatus Desantisbacteria bacterium CG_4_10_14_3_um_filter_40_18]PJB30328.1 MAG: hypothetical protein CO110_01